MPRELSKTHKLLLEDLDFSRTSRPLRILKMRMRKEPHFGPVEGGTFLGHYDGIVAAWQVLYCDLWAVTQEGPKLGRIVTLIAKYGDVDRSSREAGYIAAPTHFMPQKEGNEDLHEALERWTLHEGKAHA